MEILTRHERTFRSNVSRSSDRLTPTKAISQLRFNAMNMRVTKKSIGSKAWMEELLGAVRLMEIPELLHLVGTTSRPRTPEFIQRRQYASVQSWIQSAYLNPHKKRMGKPQRLTQRVGKAVKLMRQCPRSWTSWTTVVTSVATTKENSLKQIEADGKQLASFIERRFENAVYLLIPEVDLVLAMNIQSGLFPIAQWNRDLDPNQVVYKNHFHCVIYVPGMKPDEIEHAFKFTSNGKRSRLYSGANQVRALHVDVEPGSRDNTPDIFGCAGYSEKRHFRPVVNHRMLESFAEWLWLTDKIESNPNLVIVGGMRRGIKRYCRICETTFPLEEKCQCKPVFKVVEDFYDAPLETSTSDNINQTEIDNSNRASGEDTLNCSEPSYCNKTG